jgi:hypothetical protein
MLLPQRQSSQFDMQWIIESFPDIVCKLMIGVCGKFHFIVLDSVTELLMSLLRSIYRYLYNNNSAKVSSAELELYIFSSIRQNYDQIYLFGDHARRITQQALFQYSAIGERAVDAPTMNGNDIAVLSSSSSPSSTLSNATILIQDIWQLHQIDDPAALPGSDVVHHFIVKYSI